MIARFLVFAGIVVGLAACSDDKAQVSGDDPRWAEFESVFTKGCQSTSLGSLEAIKIGLCECTFNKIKSEVPLKDVLNGKLGDDVVQNHTAACQMSLNIIGVSFPAGARSDLVDQCTEAAGAMGDKARAYCECSTKMLENEFSYGQVMRGHVSEDDYARIGAACVGEG